MQEMVDFLVDIWEQEGLYDWLIKKIDICSLDNCKWCNSCKLF